MKDRCESKWKILLDLALKYKVDNSTGFARRQGSLWPSTEETSV